MATIITRETGATAVNRTLTNAELDNNFINLNADIATRIPSSEKAAANGVATLDATGKVPSTQLPSYVDDVLEAANLAAFPATGETGKIYVALDTNKAYRWSGSTYIYITSGAVDSVAGRTGAVVLTKSDVGLSSVDNTADADKNVLTATKWASARTLSITGDISGSASVDGSANVAITGTLPATGVTAGIYGSATAIPVITVDGKGRLTLVSTVAVSIPSGSISVTGGDLTMSGNTGTAITNATLATVNSNVGTFNTVTVNAKGLVTSASNVNYLTSYTETDTLATVTARGASTSTASTFSGGLYSRKSQTAGNYTTAALWTESYDNTATGIAFHISGVVGKFLEMRTNGTLYWNSDTVWHSGNDGSGSGLDADLLDGQHGSYYYSSGNPPPYPAEADTLATVTARGATTSSAITITAAIGDAVPALVLSPSSSSGSFQWASKSLSTGLGSGQTIIHLLGNSTGTNNSGYVGYQYGGSAESSSSFVSLGLYGNDNLLRVYGGTYTQASGSLRAPIFYDSDNTGTYINPNGSSIISSGGSYPMEFRSTQRYISRFWNTSVSGNGWWLANDSYTLVFHADSSGDKASLNTDGVFIATGSVRSPVFYDSNDTSYYLDPASTSQLNVVLLDGQSVNRALGKAHSGSDFPNGTLVITNINASATNGDSFVLECTGKSYSANPPFSFMAQGYIYADTFINCSGIHHGWAGFSTMKVLNYNGNLAFWWPRVSYWNSFEVRVREAGGSVANRVTSIIDSAEPSSSKKVSISMYTTHIAGMNSNSGPIYASIFYDSDNTGYYVDPSSTSNCNTIGAVNFRTYNAFYLGDNNYYFNNTNSGWYSNVKVQSAADMRAPVFYDIDNTGYYVDPNASTSLRTVGDWRADSSTWTGEYSGKIQYHGNNWYFQAADQFIWRNSGGSNVVYGDQSGNHWAVASSRSPIFYDNNDTGYYIDPNSTSNSALRMRGGALFGPNPTWGAYLYVGTDGRVSTSATVAVTNGNLHIDAQDGYDIYLNHYNGRWTRSNGFYDNQDTAYYLDANSTSRMYRIDFNNLYYAPDTSYGVIGTNGYFDTVNSGYASDPLELIYVRGNEVRIGPNGGDKPVKAATYYDYADTAYYVDANSTSVLSTVQALRFATNQGSQNPDSSHPGYGLRPFYSWNIGQANNSSAGYSNGITIGSHPGDQAYGFQIVQNMWDDNTYTRRYNSGWQSWITLLGSNNYSSYAVKINDWHGNLYHHTDGRIYATIFYDANDSGYYLDPNSSSRLYQTVTNISYFGADTNKGYAQGYGTYSTQLHKIARITFDWDSNYNTENHGIFSTNINGSYSDNMSINSYNDINLRIDSNDNDTASYVRFHMHTTGSNQFAYIGYDGGSYLAYFAGSVRSPIFYDSDDTSYYVDPHSTSYQRSLFLGAHDSGTSEFRFGEDSAGWYGSRWYWDSSYTHYWYSRHAGSDSIIMYHDTRYTDKIYYGRNILFDNYGIGIVGSYSSYRYQGVFAMGDSYKLPADGTTTGSLYGLAWSHPNAGGVAANLNTHGLLVMENGGFLAAVSGSIRARDDMRAPIFYDSNDTGYYCNPNSSSRFSSIYPDQIYNYGWYRNYGYTGLYNEDYGNHWYATGNDYWNLAGNNGSQVGIIFRTGGHQGTARGYVYADNSNNIGFLNSGGSWRLRVVAGDYSLADGSSMRAQLYYDSNDTNYYCDPASTTRLATLRTTGDMYINSSSPTIHFVDSDERGAALHNNSNLFYILSSNGTGGEGWATNNGYWPVYWNLNSNDATFGGSIWAAGSVTAYSDIKLKENIETIDSALDKVLKLRGVYYTLKRDESKTRKVGVIAQEIQQILPEVVMLHKDNEDQEGTLAVDYGNITAVLIEAIKEQQSEIDELKALVKQLLAK